MPTTRPVGSPGYIAILGSGELADSVAETHRTLMARLTEPPSPVFIDTMAGFELNIDQIDQKAVSYFKRNFDLNLGIARYRKAESSAETIAAALSAIQRANYLFAGPGSPSYGIRLWRDSKVWQAVVNRWQSGAMIAFSSAAALTLGACAIPVYEIYKVGEPIHWITGLNFLGELGLNLAIVPHWNNNSGDQHDTRYCFMGAARFAELEAQLLTSTTVVGIDEYTALLIDPLTRVAEVMGIGQVTVRRDGHQLLYRKGDQFNLADLSVLGGNTADVVRLVTDDEFVSVADEAESTADGSTDQDIIELRIAVQKAFDSGDYQAATEGLFTLSLIASMGLEQSMPGRTELAVQSLQVTLPLLSRIKPSTDVEKTFDLERASLLDLLINARAELRKAKQWSAADHIRDGLTAVNYTLSDTPAGTSWTRA